MTQEQAIQEAKDRVAKKYGYVNFMHAMNDFRGQVLSMSDIPKFIQIINEAILEYSSSQLEAKDREIEELKKEVMLFGDITWKQNKLLQATASSGERGDIESEKQLADKWANAEAKSGGLGRAQENALAKGYFWGRQSLTPSEHTEVKELSIEEKSLKAFSILLHYTPNYAQEILKDLEGKYGQSIYETEVKEEAVSVCCSAPVFTKNPPYTCTKCKTYCEVKPPKE